jgi:predicted aspartyl protease
MAPRPPSQAWVAALNTTADEAAASATSAEAGADAAEAGAASAVKMATEINDDTRRKLASESRKIAAESRRAAIEARNIANEARKKARAIASGSSSASVTSNDPPRHTILAGDRVALPTEKVGPYLVIEAKINGAGPFRLIVDTGSTGLGLSMEAAKKAGLKPQTDPDQGGGRGLHGLIETQVAWIDRLESGGLLLKGLSADVVAEPDLVYIRQLFGAPFDGVLGVAPLIDVILEVDFPNNQVNALRRGKQVYPAEVGCSYTLDDMDAPTPLVKVEVGDKSYLALLDTGFDGALALSHLDSVPLRSSMLKQYRLRAGLGTQLESWETSQLAGEARIGPVTLRDPPVEIGEAMIGVEALRYWKIVLDQHEQRLYFLGPELTAGWESIK